MTNEERLHRIAQIIEHVDQRCAACDGDVPPTLDVMEQSEISEIYHLATNADDETALVPKHVTWDELAKKNAIICSGVPTILICPECDKQHLDEEEWATKPHKTHLCLYCGHQWRPFEVATVGVRDERLLGELAHLRAELNKPEVTDFVAGLKREVAFQRMKWGEPHDSSKSDEDWFWLFGWLLGKAVHEPMNGMDPRDAKLHRIIACAAALCHWHAQLKAERDSTDPVDLCREFNLAWRDTGAIHA